MTQNTNQKITPIETEVGFIMGRDAIFLDKINLSEHEVSLSGELMGNNCSKLAVEDEVNFNITFKGLLLFKMVELDFEGTLINGIDDESCFDLIENSEKLAKLRAVDKAAYIGKVDRGYDENGKFSDAIYHQHFVLRTYDSVFEIIAQSYFLVTEKSELPKHITIEEALKLNKQS